MKKFDAIRKEIENLTKSIGTVEEFREAVEELKSLDAYIKQILWERDVAIQQLEEIGISLGAKMDFVKEAVEKLPKAEEVIRKLLCGDYSFSCTFCVYGEDNDAGCCNIGGGKSWCYKNAQWNGKESEEE